MLLKPIMILGVYLKELHEYGFRLSDLDLERTCIDFLL
jgi:hypothetical protein